MLDRVEAVLDNCPDEKSTGSKEVIFDIVLIDEHIIELKEFFSGSELDIFLDEILGQNPFM